MHSTFLCLFLIADLSLSVAPVWADTAALSQTEIAHFLNRASFGPAPGDVDAVRKMGIDAYLAQQLHPEHLPMPPELQQRLSQLSTLNASMPDLITAYTVPGEQEKAMSPDERKDYEKRKHIIVQELTDAKWLRATLSPAQLQEVMVDFWFNHFNVFAQKGADKIFIGAYERDAIRPFVFSKFRDLLKATAHHPAMLVYLDNAENIDPNSLQAQKAAARGKQVGINENYAREVMELHTLGVDGGYSQQDVTTLAHILTGFGLSEGKSLNERAAFYFDPKRHDYGNKQWLGHQIAGDGEPEIDRVLDILAVHPATAKHIAFQLAQYFVADQPPPSLVDKLTATYEKTDGDIAAMLKTLFHAPEFWQAATTQNKFKPPFRFIVSALRASNTMPPEDEHILQGLLRQMGEPLYECLTPNGYPATNDRWLNSDALLRRVDFDKKLAGFLDANGAQTIESALPGQWSHDTLDAVQNAPPKLQPALLLSSPEFLYY